MKKNNNDKFEELLDKACELYNKKQNEKIEKEEKEAKKKEK